MKVYTRFAPSPTGYLHLGNLRTALFNALFAYHHQGSFLLRVEDTDMNRSTEAFAEGIEEDLTWLGLTFSPYEDQEVVFQSKRHDIYEKYYQALEGKGAAYPCFCTEARLEKLRQQQKLAHQPPGYDGHCRHLEKDVVEHRKASGESYHLRFRVGESKEIVFQDGVKKEQRFKSNYLHDFVIQKSDKTPAFLYCNALDDALMGVTHVLRGEDHLTNTARQLLILEALELNAPIYSHLPLISQAATTTPLSKREASFSVRSLREQGYLPKAVLNYLARLGHTISSSELMSIKELSQVFSIENIHAGSAKFDEGQLNFWQKQAMRQQTAAEFWKSLKPSLQEKVPSEPKERFIEVMQQMITLPQEAEYWAEALFVDPLAYSLESTSAIQEAEPLFWKALLNILNDKNITEDDTLLLKAIKSCFAKIDKRQHKTHWKALRAALTNNFSGPDILSLIRLLGIPRTILRLEKAIHLPVAKL